MATKRRGWPDVSVEEKCQFGVMFSGPQGVKWRQVYDEVLEDLAITGWSRIDGREFQTGWEVGFLKGMNYVRTMVDECIKRAAGGDDDA